MNKNKKIFLWNKKMHVEKINKGITICCLVEQAIKVKIKTFKKSFFSKNFFIFISLLFLLSNIVNIIKIKKIKANVSGFNSEI